MNNSEAWFNTATVAFPEEILDIYTRGATTFILVSVGKYDGAASVFVNLCSGLESILVYQPYVPFV